jgi:hypothetical protein
LTEPAETTPGIANNSSGMKNSLWRTFTGEPRMIWMMIKPPPENCCYPGKPSNSEMYQLYSPVNKKLSQEMKLLHPGLGTIVSGYISR